MQKTTYTVEKAKGIPSIFIDLTIHAEIEKASSWFDLKKDEDIVKLERILNEHFKEEVQTFNFTGTRIQCRSHWVGRKG
ncbi:Ger(x)C family spore germination C-terminal domain-containing protein [Peribacillus frigoritolerans]|nr:Ger(x)C family spore germination C-terminal domain-containing protein [Peribacillus frigoritolerans]